MQTISHFFVIFLQDIIILQQHMLFLHTPTPFTLWLRALELHVLKCNVTSYCLPPEAVVKYSLTTEFAPNSHSFSMLST